MKRAIAAKYSFTALVLAALLFVWKLVPPGASPALIWLCLIVFYIIFAMSLRQPVTVYSRHGSFVKIDIFFLTFFYILFYLPYQFYVLGMAILSISPFLGNTYVEYTNVSIVASTIGLVSFFSGYRLSYSSRNQADPQNTSRSPADSKGFEQSCLFVILMLLIAVMALYFGEGSYAEMTTGAYRGSDRNDATSNGIYFLVTHFVMLACAASIFYIRKHGFRSPLIILSFGLTVTWCLALLVMGDRNNFFLIGVVALSGFATYLIKLERRHIFFLMMAALVLYQAVEINRNLSQRTLAGVLDAVFSAQTEPKTIDDSSFGITTASSRVAFAMVPKQHDYFFGKFKAVGFAGIIPYFRSLFVDPTDQLLTSANVLTIGLLGRGASWSVGTNIISDIYLDFGILGVVGLMWLLGSWARWIERKATRYADSMMWSTIYLVGIGLFAEVPRYSFDFPVRNIAWTFMLFALLSLIFRRSRVKVI